VRNFFRRLNFEGHLRQENLRRYLLQCTLAGVVVFLLLLLLDAVTQTVLIAALGSSTFIAFALPRSLHSGPRHMIGGYIAGILSGCLMAILNTAVDLADLMPAHAAIIVFGAVATALAMFIMVVTKTEHPPAAALALGLVLNEWNLLTLLVILAGIVSLSMLKRLVLPVLMDMI